MITLKDCLTCSPIIKSALFLTSKVAFNYKIGYVYGPDGQTYWDFAAHLNKHLHQIELRLRNNNYCFEPCREIIRKLKLNKERKVYLANWGDRIVDRWLNDSLNKLLSKWFQPNSYAYRAEHLGLEQCVRAIKQSLSPQLFIIKRDISQYFYSIDHTILLNKLSQIIDKNDYLYELLRQRIQYDYLKEDDILNRATIGIPFGTSIACILANVYLNDLDSKMLQRPIKYFRYADDFLIVGNDHNDVHEAGNELDNEILKLKLLLKPTHKFNISFLEGEGFQTITRFKHLGFEFTKDGQIRLSIEKQRKIINFFKRSINQVRDKDQNGRLQTIINLANDVINDRIRSAAIVDYYLKHITDIKQLKLIDRLIAELVISTTLQRKFRRKLFRTIPFKKLRQLGLLSLQHRHQLLKHGKIKVPFLSLYNQLKFKRYNQAIARRRERILAIKISKKQQNEVSK